MMKCPICNRDYEAHLPWELLNCNDKSNGGVEKVLFRRYKFLKDKN